MTKSLKLGIGLVFLVQLIVAASFGLAHDEAYYWLFSRHLDWGYFDHPPFVAAVIALFSFLPHHEFSVRVGFVLLQAGSLFFIFRLLNPKHWQIAFLLYFSFPLASFTGLLALPDMPLLFMTSVYFYFLKRYLEGDKKSVFILGLVIALLLYAKYHGILLIFFTILALPRLLLTKEFWLVAIISLLIFSPHLWWQYQHEFTTLKYHFLERPSSSFSVKRIWDYVGTQIALTGLFAGPIIWWKLSRMKASGKFERALLFNAWGIFFFFLVSTISKKVEANWTISLAIPLIALLAGDEVWDRKWARSLLYLSFSITVLARLIFPFSQLPIKRMGEFHGWKSWAREVDAKCEGKKLLANSYQIASKLSFYLEREVPSLNFHSRRNQFDLWPKDILGEVCYITDKSEFSGLMTLTPENKELKIVKQRGENLILMKVEANARNLHKP